jgi:DNA-binding response OmpR family regulator
MSEPVVLLVEDEALLRHALARALQHFGFRAVGVCDAESALTILTETAVDAVVVDLNLPSTRGDALALALMRRWPYLRGRIILMSGDIWSRVDGWPDELRECPLLAKPFPLEALTRSLHGLLERAAPAPRRHEQA